MAATARNVQVAGEILLQPQDQEEVPGGKSAVEEEAETCCICVDEFVPEDKIRITVCDHIFHNQCLVQWLEHKLKQNEKPDCPNCRKALGREIKSKN